MVVEKQPAFYRNHYIRDAIGRALYDAMKLDPVIHLFGEGSLIKQHYDAPQIEREFGDRVHTLPISEDGNIGFAVGASLIGVKPVYDIITADFAYRCFDSICNTCAKLNFVAPKGEPHKTIVIRAEFLTAGPTTGQRPEALFTHIPGLNVVIPSTPRDAYGLMLTALSTPGVTLFFEDRELKDAETRPSEMDLQVDAIPFGSASVEWQYPGARLLIVTYGLMRQVVESVLDKQAIQGVDLLDLRTLYPIDWKGLTDFAERTHKVLIVEPDVTYGGIGAEIAATLAERGVRVKRLGAPRETIPASRYLHERMLPTEDAILKAIEAMI